MARGSRGQTRAPKRRARGEDVQTFGVRYSRKLGETIADRLAKGGIWSRICHEDGMPSYTTLYDWKKKRPEFAELLAQAREALADLHADQALIVAEEGTAENVARDRLRVSTLQWRADRVAKPAAKGEAERPRLVVEIRRFEKVVRPDGSVTVRAIPNVVR